MNAEERFDAALKEFSEAYRDYVMSSTNLTVYPTVSPGYVGNISFNIKGKKYDIAVGDNNFVCIHDIENFIGSLFSKSDCKKLKEIIVDTLGDADKQNRIKELEKELKRLKGE